LITYSVSVDTSAITGASGYVDFQFNPARAASLAATAVVDSFATDGTLGSALPNLGDAAGVLPGTLTLDNGTPTNEITQGFLFGRAISFDVTLSGPAVGASGPDASTFFLTLFDAGQNPYSTGPGGAIATIDINADGSTTPITYAPLVVPGPTATITTASAVPEPSTAILAALGMALTILLRAGGRKRQRGQKRQRAQDPNRQLEETKGSGPKSTVGRDKGVRTQIDSCLEETKGSGPKSEETKGSGPKSTVEETKGSGPKSTVVCPSLTVTGPIRSSGFDEPWRQTVATRSTTRCRQSGARSRRRTPAAAGSDGSAGGSGLDRGTNVATAGGSPAAGASAGPGSRRSPGVGPHGYVLTPAPRASRVVSK
jgi:hypothetical protein